MTRRIQPVAKSSFRVQIGEFGNVYFQTAGAISGNRERTAVPSPNTRKKTYLFGLTEYDEIELSKVFEPETDQALIDLLERCTDEKLTVTIQPVRNCPDEQAVGQLTTLLGCVVTGIEFSEADRDSSDASMLMLTISFEDVQRG